jgi:hypothetical protein
MAQHMLTPPEVGFVDKNRNGKGDSSMEPDFTGALVDNTSLDTKLLTLGGCYTQSYIDKMTQNDKVYAVRMAVDPTQFK